MRAIIVPGAMALLGGAVGLGAAALTASPGGSATPRVAPEAGHEASEAPKADSGHGGTASALGESDYVRLSNQFVIPIVEGDEVSSLVILSIALGVTPGTADAAYAIEPRLRAAFLGVMFDHANAGGFSGRFTEGPAMDALRRALAETARGLLGEGVLDVLITDIVRQDN